MPKVAKARKERTKTEKEATKTIASKKLKALQEGHLTDIVFRAGQTEETAEDVHASKFDLMVSSPFFTSLLNNPLTQKQDGKIVLKIIEPQILRIIVEFTHLCREPNSNVESLETCLKLAAAADEFLIKDLGLMCSKLLEDKFLRVDNVWQVLSNYSRIRTIAAPCLKLLSSKTSECLRHEGFLQASEDALKQLLILEEMDIRSEAELVRACIQYTSNNYKDQRAAFRKICLRHLRLLTLDFKLVVEELSEFLTNAEMMYLGSFLNVQKGDWKPQAMPKSLCPTAASRAMQVPQLLLLLLHGDDMDINNIRLYQTYRLYHAFGLTFILKLTSKVNVKILGFEIFCQLKFQNLLEESSGNGKYLNSLAISFTVSDNLGRNVDSGNIVVSESFEFNSVAFIEQCVLLPAGHTLYLQAQMRGQQQVTLRKGIFQKHMLSSYNSEAVQDCFHVDRVECTGTLNGFNSFNHGRFDACLFKSVHFELV